VRQLDFKKETAVILASIEPVEWGAIVAGVVVVVAFIWWRIRMGRPTKQEKEKLDTAP
jgi:hypothetical protein